MGTRNDNSEGADGLTTVRSRGGGIGVTCTSTGLPVAIKLEPAQCRREPDALAADILALCRFAGLTAGVRRRAALTEQGVPDETLALLGLPSRADLVASEERLDAGGTQR
ncbi:MULTISPECIES: hypothetical protein [unclassified Gordonia (in: high G+C Gram-positive bacteria)]|uniref:hypothetical protein n=1 Tax=unclassified Gordonia (in: high G+C Gram-positive bacteria) TaxID=2657482 RepID=UPI001F06DADB|nr:hypothetical protein [Gordonia sp. PDNC005]